MADEMHHCKLEHLSAVATDQPLVWCIHPHLRCEASVSIRGVNVGKVISNTWPTRSDVGCNTTTS